MQYGVRACVRACMCVISVVNCIPHYYTSLLFHTIIHYLYLTIIPHYYFTLIFTIYTSLLKKNSTSQAAWPETDRGNSMFPIRSFLCYFFISIWPLCACVFVHMRAFVHICVFVCMAVPVCACMCGCMYVCMCVCIRVSVITYECTPTYFEQEDAKGNC